MHVWVAVYIINSVGPDDGNPHRNNPTVNSTATTDYEGGDTIGVAPQATVSVCHCETVSYLFKIEIVIQDENGDTVATSTSTISVSPGSSTTFGGTLSYVAPSNGGHYYTIGITLSSYEPSAGEEVLDESYEEFGWE